MFKKTLKKIISYSDYSIINSKKRKKYNLENTFDYLIKKINKGQKFIIFDVGGHIGVFTIYFMTLLNKYNIKNFEIHLFEPNSKAIEEAKKNISNVDVWLSILKTKFKEFELGNKNEIKEFYKLEAVNKVIFNEFALGTKNEIKEFYLHEKATNSSFLKTRDDDSQKHNKYEIKKVEKKISTIDHYMAQNNIEHLDILKIDTQGFNTEVLAGAIKSLENQIIKSIYSEIIIGTNYEKSENFYDFEKYLLKNNYCFFGLDTGINSVRVISRYYRRDINLDVFYTNLKYVDI